MAEEFSSKSRCWQSSLAVIPDDRFEEHRSRLRTEFLACRSKVKAIVGKIAEVLPGLTVHDVSHLDALWETADLIAGEDYPLNPLEGFVLGLSILFHDSAMCWEAYEGGRDGVRRTIAWKDAYAHECHISPDTSDEIRQNSADFAALRALHADQAQRLTEMHWVHPDTEQKIYLIDNDTLRTEVGGLAGKIAASHHWSTDDLVKKLGEQFNAPHPYPTEWSVDPIKIACLLRCADAAHINNARAPLFLYALIKRQGISQQHWKAQNRMTGPALDQGDRTNTTLIYTSSRPYKESDAQAWWIAYDVISIISQEIEASNQLLRERKRPTSPEFAIRRIGGTESLEELTQYLQVEGWMPCQAQPHVSNVESLVRTLGGENLYGKISLTHSFGVALRELIQNARDAVMARQFVDPGFQGEIWVSLTVDGEDTWLTVEDNGVGMSQRVMTGPLLDFGNSFWKSSLVAKEFPGLRSSPFQSIGQFGIGFYSIFMIADFVEVTSKAWDKGLDESNTLRFTSNVSLRPILRHGRPSNFSSQKSTQVKIKIKPGLFSPDRKISIDDSDPNRSTIQCSVKEFVTTLVIGLDVPVQFIDENNDTSLAHDVKISTDQIMSCLCFLSRKEDPYLEDYIAKNHHRLRPIQSGQQTFGMAAIANLSYIRLGVCTIGGLWTQPEALPFEKLFTSPTTTHIGHSFIGYIDCKPNSAKRDATDFSAPQDALQEWATEQLRILESQGITDRERLVVGEYASDFHCDPIKFARVRVSMAGKNALLDYEQLATLAEDMPVGILKMSAEPRVELHHSMAYIDYTKNIDYNNYIKNIKIHSKDMHLILPITCSAISCSLLIEKGQPGHPNSIIGCLHRAIQSRGRIPQWERLPTTLKSIFGAPMEILRVTST